MSLKDQIAADLKQALQEGDETRKTHPPPSHVRRP